MERIYCVMGEIMSFLHGAKVEDVCSFNATSILAHNFVTQDKSMRKFWYKMLRRTAHVVSYSYLLCYLNEPNWYEWNNLIEVRELHGDCYNERHVRLRADLEKVNLSTRDLYTEWQSVAYRRFRRRYWSCKKNKILTTLIEKVKELKQQREKANWMDHVYKDINKRELKRIKKVKLM